MTREEYGAAYEKGFGTTVRFLQTKGAFYDAAVETVQAAWAKGWERLYQLQDPHRLLVWMNSVAYNLFRSSFRHAEMQALSAEIAPTSYLNLSAMDARRILKLCNHSDRQLLEQHYFDGYKVQEIAELTGIVENNVRVRLTRARKNARKILKMSAIPKLRTKRKARTTISKAV